MKAAGCEAENEEAVDDPETVNDFPAVFGIHPFVAILSVSHGLAPTINLYLIVRTKATLIIVRSVDRTGRQRRNDLRRHLQGLSTFQIHL